MPNLTRQKAQVWWNGGAGSPWYEKLNDKKDDKPWVLGRKLWDMSNISSYFMVPGSKTPSPNRIYINTSIINWCQSPVFPVRSSAFDLLQREQRSLMVRRSKHVVHGMEGSGENLRCFDPTEALLVDDSFRDSTRNPYQPTCVDSTNYPVYTTRSHWMYIQYTT